MGANPDKRPWTIIRGGRLRGGIGEYYGVLYYRTEWVIYYRKDNFLRFFLFFFRYAEMTITFEIMSGVGVGIKSC